MDDLLNTIRSAVKTPKNNKNNKNAKHTSDDDDDGAMMASDDAMIDEDDLDDDDDDDDDYNNHRSSSTATRHLTAEEEELIREQKALFERAKQRQQAQQAQQQQQQKKKEKTKLANKYILYTDPTEGQVLRFSDLFGPKSYDLDRDDVCLSVKRRKYLRKKKLQQQQQQQQSRKKLISPTPPTAKTQPPGAPPALQDFHEVEKLFYDKDVKRREETSDEIMRKKAVREQFERSLRLMREREEQEVERRRWRQTQASHPFVRSRSIQQYEQYEQYEQGDVKQVEEEAEEAEEEGVVTVVMDEEEKLLNDPSNFGLLPFDQIEWEKDILWGTGTGHNDHDEERRRNRMMMMMMMDGFHERVDVHHDTGVGVGVAGDHHTHDDDDVAASIMGDASLKNLKLNPATASLSYATRVNSTTGHHHHRHHHATAAHNTAGSGSQHLQHMFNEELLSCDWLDRVTWDNDVGPKKPLCSDLVFDLNDPDMIFEEINPNENLAAQSVADAKKADSLNATIRKYNVANDAEYVDSTKHATGPSMTKGRHIVRHSVPALKLDKSYFKTQLKEEELRRLHRPRIKFTTNQVMPILYRAPKKEKKSRRKPKIIEKKMELSAHDHRLILVEYIEQKPAVLNNTGMGTKICNYFKKKDETSLVSKAEDGVPYLIDSQDALPLLGPLKEEEFFTSIENSMYSAQLFKHTPPSTDFLLTTRKMGDELKFYIRPIPMYYTAGHTQPNTEVPAPNSRVDGTFCKNRLNLFIYRRFKEAKERGKQMKLQIDDVKNAFPDMPDTTIRKCLKQCATFKRGGGDSGWWYAKPDFVIPSEEDLQAMVTPEMVCLHESMSSGKLRHEEVGVNEMAGMVSYKYAPAVREKGRIRDTIRFIEQEINNTPWSKTINFLNMGKDIPSLDILSVVNQNLKPEDINRLTKEIEAAVKSEAESIVPNLTDAEARKILADSGMSEESINAMNKPGRRQSAKKILAERSLDTASSNIMDGGSSLDAKQNAAANKKDAKEIARNAKFRQVLQNVFAIEAYKLSNGIEYYTDVKEEEALRALYPSRYVSETSFSSSAEHDSMSDESDEDEQMLQSLMSQTETPKPSTPAPPEKRHIVRKTKTIKLPDGTTKTEIEIIKDPTLVNFYMEKKRIQEQNKNKKKGKRGQIDDDNEAYKSGGKEARRLQDMYRRYMKTYTADGPDSKKKRRSTLAQTEYQVSSAANDRRKERQEKLKQKKLLREKAKEKKTKQKKGNTVVSVDDNKLKIKLSAKEEKALAKSKDTPAQAQGLKIHIPASVIEEQKQASEAKKTKKRKQSSTKASTTTSEASSSSSSSSSAAASSASSSSSSNSRPTKKAKTSAAKPPAIPVAKPVTSIAQKEQEYVEKLIRPQTSRRRKTTGDQLAEVFKAILDEINANVHSNDFKHPVNVKMFPDYRKIVTNPMDLSTMARNVANFAYMDERSFRADFERMIDNSIKFCTGRFPMVVESARALLDHFNTVMAKYTSRIQQIMSDVNTPTSASSTSQEAMFPSNNK